MRRDLVSVVIPHHGDPTPTLELVGQLRAQHRDGGRHLEIFVVDDASPEPFPLSCDDGVPIDVVRRDVNGGFAAAVNSGVAVAGGDMLLVLNSDVTVPPDFVEALIAGAHPLWPAVVTPRVMESFGERCLGHAWPTWPGVVLEYLLPLVRLHGSSWFEHRVGNLVETVGAEEPVEVDWVTGICMLMPLADVRAVGGLDERYFMNCEEVDLQLRLHRERELRAVVLPHPVIRHVGGGSSPSQKRAGWVLDARMRYAAKWGGATRLLGGLVLAAHVNLLWNGARSLLGRKTDARRHYQVELDQIRHAWRTRG